MFSARSGLLILLLLLLPAYICGYAYAGSERQDPSFARIVITPADYARGAREKQSSKSHDYVSLPEIARKTMYRYFGKDDLSKNKSGVNEWIDSLKIEPKFLKPAGVFVTLSKNGKTRACWGSVYPREGNIAKETVVSTLGALVKDYRFKPVSAVEMKKLKVQVTVVRGLDAVSDVKMIDPFKDGIMVRSGGRGGVILPGEAVDAYYEFVLARLKAGIKPDEPCQIYRIRAEIYD